METPTDCSASRLLLVCPAESWAVHEYLRQQFTMAVDWVTRPEQLDEFLALHGGRYQVAIVQLLANDSPEETALDRLASAGVAAVVLTGAMTETTYQRIAFRPIVDFVDTSRPGALGSVARIVKRTLRNLERHVLLVDGSEGFADYQAGLLRNQRLQVSTASGAAQALAALRTNPDIALVIVDQHLADGDGVDLTVELRSRCAAGNVAILGVSGAEDPFVAVRFLKSGADDILRKPFLVEEFASRVNGLLDHLDTINQVRNQANRDYMTGLYNRRYLFEAGTALFENARRENLNLCVAVIDIDHFKHINDSHGHDVGDLAIVALAHELTHSFRATDLVARIGGEEFCVLVVNPQNALALMERLRARVEAVRVNLSEQAEPLHMTISIGLCAPLGQNLAAMIKSADEALYRAKQGGRNRVELVQ